MSHTYFVNGINKGDYYPDVERFAIRQAIETGADQIITDETGKVTDRFYQGPSGLASRGERPSWEKRYSRE